MFTRFDAVYSLLLPALLPYLGYRTLRKGKYHESSRGMAGLDLPQGAERERFRDGSVWIHAVSVGETVAAKSIAPLMREVAPDTPMVASTITETGQAHAKKIITEADHVHYFPLDFSWNVRRFLKCFNPRVFIMMETEIWPNFLSQAARHGTQVFMVNGKLSEKSFRGYRRGRLFLRPAFDGIRAFCMQTEVDAERMRALCGRPEDVYVTGNCKFDAPASTLSPDEASAFRKRYRLGAQRPTLVVGSTHPGEEEIILAAFAEARRSTPNLQLILSPRHPERFNEVAALCQGHEAGWSVSRATKPDVDSPDIFLLDVMGELARAYGLGDVAVVAGSFCKIGGHNLLEPAVHSVPVVVGPQMHAQKEINRLFQESSSGCVRCEAETLGATLTDLFQNETKRARVGAEALATARRHQGSARASVEIIRKYLDIVR